MTMGPGAAPAQAASHAGRHAGFARSVTPAGTLTLVRGGRGRPLPDGFLGLSFEFRALEDYAGSSPAALDRPFLQLVRDIAPGQSPVLRIGGDSTDWTWWPVRGMRRPGGARFDLGTEWVNVARAVVQALGARLILGVNFEADSRRLARAMARGIVDGIGARSIGALELGNEPELYSSFNWYRTPSGQGIRGRAAGYNVSSYLRDYAGIAASLPRVPLAGPSSGAAAYLDYLGNFLRRNRRVSLVTVHAYPLKHCTHADHPSDTQLLAPSTSRSLTAQLGVYTAVAHANGRPLRVDELNSVSCGGYAPVTYTFGAALWALGQLFELDAVGVDGVNFHTVPNTTQHLIAVNDAGGHWTAAVLPEYYGLLAFAQAAPAGSRLARLAGALPAGVSAYATVGPGRSMHYVLVNAGAARATVRLVPPWAGATARLSRLSAPGPESTGAVTLGGQSIDPTTGALSGRSKITTLAAAAGAFVVALPGYSAAIVSVP